MPILKEHEQPREEAAQSKLGAWRAKGCRGREGRTEGGGVCLVSTLLRLGSQGHLCKEERECMGREGGRKATEVGRVGYEDGWINPSHPQLCNILKFNFELLSEVLGATFYSDGLHSRGIKCLLKN